MKYKAECPMCGSWWVIELSDDQATRLEEYRRGGRLIQELLSDLNATEREFLKSDYCPRCQEEIFGNGVTDKIKEME